MIKTLLSLLLMAFASATMAQTADETAIKNVVTSAYIEGIQNRGSGEKPHWKAEQNL